MATTPPLFQHCDGCGERSHCQRHGCYTWNDASRQRLNAREAAAAAQDVKDKEDRDAPGSWDEFSRSWKK
jgi:hypothetical protein